MHQTVLHGQFPIIKFEKIKGELLNFSVADTPVLYGGPVQPERGFVLHEVTAGEWDSTITIAENTALTTSKDILESVAIGSGPAKMLLTLMRGPGLNL